MELQADPSVKVIQPLRTIKDQIDKQLKISTNYQPHFICLIQNLYKFPFIHVSMCDRYEQQERENTRKRNFETQR